MSQGRVNNYFPAQKGQSKDLKVVHDSKKVKLEKDADNKQDVNEAGLNILREFDLNWKYGPCVGITRLERWNRAAKHGLNPPTNVKDIIKNHMSDKAYTQKSVNKVKKELKQKI